MGGPGSGRSLRRRLRHIGRPLVEEAIALDVAALCRSGVLMPGCHVTATRSLSEASGGQSLTIRIEADLTRWAEGGDRIHLSFQARGSLQHQTIRLEALPQHLGGERLWFVCPVTGRRARVLYLRVGGSRFASRNAHGLVHRSTRETADERRITRIQRIRLRLKGSPSIYAPVPRKPKGMHGETYWALLSKLAQASR